MCNVNMLTSVQWPTGTEQSIPESAEPMTLDPVRPSASESAPESQSAEALSTEEPLESEADNSYQLSFSLGGDAAGDNQLPAFGADSAAAMEGFGIGLESDSADVDESSAAPVTQDNVMRGRRDTRCRLNGA